MGESHISLIAQELSLNVNQIRAVNDITGGLAKPGRDFREKFEVFEFEKGINAISKFKTKQYDLIVFLDYNALN